MQIDIEKTPLQNLIGLIISANEGTELTENQFNFLNPVPLDEVEGDLNTSIKLVAVPGEGYISNVTFRYTRLPLDVNLNQPLEDLLVEDGCEENDIYEHLLSKLNLMPSEIELVSYTPPVVNDEIGMDITYGNIVIKAKDNSLLYSGTYSLTLAPDINPALNEVFAITDLDGFTPSTITT